MLRYNSPCEVISIYALHQPGSADIGIVDDHIVDSNKSAICWQISYSCGHAQLVYLSSLRKTESQNFSMQVKPTVLDFTHHEFLGFLAAQSDWVMGQLSHLYWASLPQTT